MRGLPIRRLQSYPTSQQLWMIEAELDTNE